MSTGKASTSAQSRISVIDAIRGLAVFWILLASIQSWSGYKFIPITQIEKLPLVEWLWRCLTQGEWQSNIRTDPALPAASL